MIGLIARPYDMTIIGAGYFGAIAPVAAFPPSNGANNDYGRVVTFTNATAADQTVTCIYDLYAPQVVDTISLLWHTFLPGEVFRFIGSNNPDFTAAVYDQPNVPVITGWTTRSQLSRWKCLLTTDGGYSARYWCVQFNLPKGATRSFSRFILAKKANFVVGPQKATIGAKDMNASVTTEVGEQRSQEDPNQIRPVASLSLEYAKQSEMEQMLGQYTLSLGVSKPFLICTDLTSSYVQDNTVFGRAEKVVTLESSIYDVWSFEAVVTSLGV